MAFDGTEMRRIKQAYPSVGGLINVWFSTQFKYIKTSRIGKCLLESKFMKRACQKDI